MRLPFLRPKTPAAAEPAPRRGRAAVTTTVDDSAVQLARTRARRRLVGALVLLVIGTVGFPVLFETQPRPLPVDTPIEVARRSDGTLQPGAIQPVTEQAAPTLPSAAAPAAPPPDAASEAEPAPTTAPVPAAAPTPAPAPAPSPEAKPPAVAVAAAKPQVKLPIPASQPVLDAPARPQSVTVSTVPAPRPQSAASAAVPAPVAASGPGRYVVQVGAYSDNATLRDARNKVERLGLKTYTQAVDTAAGQRTRVRVGPFATREEADGAAGKIKRSGLPANILVL